MILIKVVSIPMSSEIISASSWILLGELEACSLIISIVLSKLNFLLLIHTRTRFKSLAKLNVFSILSINSLK